MKIKNIVLMSFLMAVMGSALPEVRDSSEISGFNFDQDGDIYNIHQFWIDTCLSAANENRVGLCSELAEHQARVLEDHAGQDESVSEDLADSSGDLDEITEPNEGVYRNNEVDPTVRHFTSGASAKSVCVVESDNFTLCWDDGNRFWNMGAPRHEQSIASVTGDQLSCHIRLLDNTPVCWGNTLVSDVNVDFYYGPHAQGFLIGGKDIACVIHLDFTLECSPANTIPFLDGAKFKQASLDPNGRALCGIALDNGLTCLSDGRVGHDSLITKVPSNYRARQVVLGRHDGHICVINLDASVTCWENESEDTGIVDVPDNLRAKKIVTGSRHVCAISLDDEAICWGRGHLFDAYAGDAVTIPRGLGKVKAITAGYNHTCAITQNDALQCWGYSAIVENMPGHLKEVGSVLNF